ncbi:NADH dehydrogenase subunit 1 (mitochondrion) [Varroa destructor]|uniref:NADH-ubiquinone oxidoreductase chain 1 n=1 Tax=Varroa destructor TaxID=109461 RepID=A0A7M6W8M3_VARDE|nr:NADH dehydrogenase subunit 1 [Varroa destructor]
MSFVFLKIFIIINILLSIAFITLLERKILGYIQYRKGPNKLGIMGLLQPFSDAIKLFSKNKLDLNYYNKIIYFISPMMALTLMLSFWMMIYFPFSKGKSINYEFLMFLFISSMSIYPIIFSGWSSNSKYAILGAYRGVAQTISYEVSFSFILISLLILNNNINLSNLNIIQMNFKWLIFGFFPMFLIWMTILMAETNRTPFDLAESESELVSGFNIEYSGLEFALIFMAEYGNIIFMSFVTSMLFLGGSSYFLTLKILIISILFLIIRGTLIRYRYDMLMYMAWKTILPFSMTFLLFSTIYFFFWLNLSIH